MIRTRVTECYTYTHTLFMAAMEVKAASASVWTNVALADRMTKASINLVLQAMKKMYS